MVVFLLFERKEYLCTLAKSQNSLVFSPCNCKYLCNPRIAPLHMLNLLLVLLMVKRKYLIGHFVIK